MARTEPRRALIVENESLWQDVISGYVKDVAGPEVKIEIAANSEEALQLLQMHSYDLATTDVLLERASPLPWETIAERLSELGTPNIVISIEREFWNERDWLNRFDIVGFFDKRNVTPTEVRLLKRKMSKYLVSAPRLPHPKGTPDCSLLHISDLHFGEKHRFNEPNTKGVFPPGELPSLSELVLDDIRGLKATIAGVVISGDLTQVADAGEFARARSMIEALLRGLKLTKDHLLIVPGNHDINWNRQGNHWQRDDGPTQEYRDSIELLTRQSPRDYARLYDIKYLAEADVALIGLDSCVIEKDTLAGVGYVGSHQLQNALALSTTLAKEHPDCILIAALHHHLLPVVSFGQLPEKEKQFTLVMDAPAVLERLYKAHFSAVLHGHRHHPYCANFQLPSAETVLGMGIIGAGSLGICDSELGPIRQNHYNIINLTRQRTGIRVHVESRRTADDEPLRFVSYGNMDFLAQR